MQRVQVPLKGVFATVLLSAVAVLILAPTFSQAAAPPPLGQFVKISDAEQDAAVAQGAAGETQSRRPTPYIVGGGESTFDRHPWLVQITLNGKAFCGGALVHPMLVLTAAHCLFDQTDQTWWFQKGTMQAFTGRTISESGGEQLNLASAGIATNYQGLSNDWGFIALSSPSSRPVLKIAGPDEGAVWRAGRTALVAGFGNIVQDGAASPTLKELSVPLLADTVCGATGSYGTSYNPAVMLCSGIVAGGSGTCQGDSGGPLTVPVDGGGRRIVGVVSWGDGCAKPNKPTVYSRVAAPTVSTEVNALARQAAQNLNFPGAYADSNVLGSGAKPVGCAAAQGASAGAQAALGAANGELAKAKKAVPRTKKAAKKAKKVATKAKRAVKKTPKRKKAKAKNKLKRANKDLKKATKKAKRARVRTKTAKNAARGAQGAANSAAATAAATCN